MQQRGYTVLSAREISEAAAKLLFVCFALVDFAYKNVATLRLSELVEFFPFACIEDDAEKRMRHNNLYV